MQMINRKWIVGLTVFLVIATIALYGYREYHRTNLPMSDMKFSERISSEDLLTAFKKDDSAANARFLGKVLLVEGPVKKIDLPNNMLSLGNQASASSVHCSLESVTVPGATLLAAGHIIVIKGNCTGYNEDEILGSDVIMNRAVIVEVKGTVH